MNNEANYCLFHSLTKKINKIFLGKIPLHNGFRLSRNYQLKQHSYKKFSNII